MNAEEKLAVLDLVNRLPEHATLRDLVQTLERAARSNTPSQPSASGWLIGQACREQCHRVARVRAERFAERMLPLFVPEETSGI